MLTQDQIDKLQPLLQHPKFGNLLKESIKNWKITTPSTGIYGIITNESNKFEINPKLDNCCCLISSSLIGKYDHGSLENDRDYWANVHNSASSEYDISISEIEELMSGFDGDFIGVNAEAYNFGKEVANIVID